MVVVQSYLFAVFLCFITLQVVLAICVGVVAQKVSLVVAFGIMATVYGLSFVAASWPVKTAMREEVTAG